MAKTMIGKIAPATGTARFFHPARFFESSMASIGAKRKSAPAVAGITAINGKNQIIIASLELEPKLMIKIGVQPIATDKTIRKTKDTKQNFRKKY